MSDTVFGSRVALVQRASGVGLLLRILIVVAPITAIACTRLAGGGFSSADTMFLDALIIVLAVVCVVLPDGHVGTAVLALLTAEWLAVVDDPVTPWALGTATAFAVFHTSLAAASVAAPSARWTTAMWHRWLRRATVLIIAAAGTTIAVIAADHLRLSGSGVVLTAALVTIAVGGTWAAAARDRRGPRP